METATDADVTRLPLPTSIQIEGQMSDLAPTPNEMRAIKTASGMRLDYLFDPSSDADADDRVQAFTWLALRRAGYDASWNDAGDVRLVQADEPPDPTNGEP